MNIYFKISGVFISIILLSCSPSRKTDMNSKEQFSFVCDINSDSCIPKSKKNSNQKMEATIKTNSKPKLIYYFDALCGWCYGFSSVMSELESEFGDQLDIEVISGGLFLGHRAGAVNLVAPHIKAGAYKSVETRTGVKFGETFLNDVNQEGKTILNSLPPTIALCIVKEKFPEYELKFASMLLYAVYYDGLNPIDVEGLANYASKIGFEKEEFISKMAETKYENLAKSEFEKFSESPFSGMPALVLNKEGQQVLLSNGYTDFESIKAKLMILLSNNL